jgi:hypothetical protein
VIKEILSGMSMCVLRAQNSSVTSSSLGTLSLGCIWKAFVLYQMIIFLSPERTSVTHKMEKDMLIYKILSLSLCTFEAFVDPPSK